MIRLRNLIAIFLVNYRLASSFITLSSNRGLGTSSRTKAQYTLHRRNASSNSIWDRLGLEEDDEPMWYLLNCVAGNEIDLLNQCTAACAEFVGNDVIKFVVPTVSSVRSHGANRMVNDVKVKYQGYVFGKLRLCKQVYETIQGLDLCRSWMGTVNHKGYRKLPPAPLALNEEEIEKFGLEDIEDEIILSSTTHATDNVIVDLPGGTVDTNLINPADLKVYRGLKVEDMVKVTSQNKFFNEDGIVRRLKEGKVLVRFFTYGSMYEEWLQPSDVRKLSSMEILRGLAGPGRPVTQQDLDAVGNGRTKEKGSTRRGDSENMLRQAFTPGGSQSRNRKQDRIANKFKFRDASGDEQRRDERNWSWYQEQQSQAGAKNNGKRGRDSWTSEVDPTIGELDNDVTSQWRRKSQPKEDRRASYKRSQAASDTEVEWSTFVTSNAKADRLTTSSDAFFDSLMGDLSKDLNSEDGTTIEEAKHSKLSGGNDDEEDFFSSLISDLSLLDDTSHQRSISTRSASTVALPTSGDKAADDDFFSSLLSTLLPDEGTPSSRQQMMRDEEQNLGMTSYRPPSSIVDSTVDTDSLVKPPRLTEGKLPSDLNKCTVPILKELLRQRGLKVSGTKSELIARLANL